MHLLILVTHVMAFICINIFKSSFVLSGILKCPRVTQKQAHFTFIKVSTHIRHKTCTIQGYMKFAFDNLLINVMKNAYKLKVKIKINN
jgi:hypothetical protein